MKAHLPRPDEMNIGRMWMNVLLGNLGLTVLLLSMYYKHSESIYTCHHAPPNSGGYALSSGVYIRLSAFTRYWIWGHC